MNWSKYIFTHYTLWNNNCIFKIVSFPRHKSNHKITSKSKFTILSCIPFSKYLSGNYLLTFSNNRFQVNTCILVCFPIFWEFVSFQFTLEWDKLFFLFQIVFNYNLIWVNIFNLTFSLGNNEKSWITNNIAFNTCTYNWCFRRNQRNCLTHHIRSHKCAVGIIMLKKRYKRCGYRSNLVWSNIHQLYLFRCS